MIVLESITDEVLTEFKNLYIKETGLGVESDETFKNLLENAYAYIVSKSDDFNITEDKIGKQLVFDRARYVRANASELFYENYLPDLNAFGLKLGMERENDGAS